METSFKPTLALALALALASCGSLKTEPKSLTSGEQRQELQLQYDARRQELEKTLAGQTAHWPVPADCDGALWAGVARRAGLDQVDVSQALTQEGRPTRRPGQDCGPTSEGLAGDSAATTSSDMILGIVLGLHSAKDVDSLQRLWDYGKQESWVMGVPKSLVSRVLLKPTGIGMLAEAIKSLGGREHNERWVPNPPLPVEADYEEHLQALSVLLQRDTGRDPSGPTTCSKRQEDALIQAVCRDFSRAASLLLGSYKSPSYVRAGVGEDKETRQDILERVHWLLAAKVTLEGGK